MFEKTTFDSEVFCSGAFRNYMETAMPVLVRYLDCNIPKGVNVHDPSILTEMARELMVGDTGAPASFDGVRFCRILNLYMHTGLFVHTPGSMGRQYSGTFPLAAVTDMVSSVVNQPCSFYEASQLPCVAEKIMASELNRFIGFDSSRFAMLTTSGGSLANLTALLAAKNHKYPGCLSGGLSACCANGLPAVAMGEDAHYSLVRVVEVLGIGEEQIVRLPLNEKRQIDVNRVQETLDRAAVSGLDVFCLVASAGTTSVGAIDPLEELAEIAQENNLWYHVDGCHGASLLLSDKLRPLLEGIGRADSISWDAHKMMSVPSPCSLLFYKDRETAGGAFRQEASYVFDREPAIYSEYEGGSMNFECTKRPMIMNLWILWAMHGRTLFSARIEQLCALCMESYHILLENQDFEALHSPQTNILCFRYRPENLPEKFPYSLFQQEIRKRVCCAGRYFISKTDIAGETALRVVIMNYGHTSDNFRELLQEIRKAGQDVIFEYKNISN